MIVIIIIIIMIIITIIINDYASNFKVKIILKEDSIAIN